MQARSLPVSARPPIAPFYMRLFLPFLIGLGVLLLPHSSKAASPVEIQDPVARQIKDSKPAPTPVVRFTFDGVNPGSAEGTASDNAKFGKGLEGQALTLRPESPAAVVLSDRENLTFDSSHDFTIQFWIRTVADSDRRFVILSQKDVLDNSLSAQKQSGWLFYVSSGTWAWNMGSGSRRITYERSNGKHMPVNDGRWHQLTMTYDSKRSDVRLFYDGDNKVLYHVSDEVGFDFTSSSPLKVGWDGEAAEPAESLLPSMVTGAGQLQELVDAFNNLGLSAVESDEFASLIVDPKALFEQKVSEAADLQGADRASFLESMESVDFGVIERVEADLMRNPYTVHQAMSFMEASPLLKIFSLVDGKVIIQSSAADAFAEREQLHPSNFDLDNLAIWDRALAPDEVLRSYSDYFTPAIQELAEEVATLSAASWNIFHGGLHFTVEEHGWDSRIAIAEILKRENADVVMMQETYSGGDFIAAELGYYFATTVDWDYLNQGANISILSRYPITELYVPEDSPFMNVAVKISISNTQELYAMSNWYGMQQFSSVFSFHEARFAESDVIPTVFAGDFNAIPHTDGGDSPASQRLLDAGFTDAFRSLYPDVQAYPGYTHRSGQRIDQLYYKGAGLNNTSTRKISTWPTGFPSDHYLILSRFELNYSTPGVGPRQ